VALLLLGLHMFGQRAYGWELKQAGDLNRRAEAILNLGDDRGESQ
jgi:hypothetical protein